MCFQRHLVQCRAGNNVDEVRRRAGRSAVVHLPQHQRVQPRHLAHHLGHILGLRHGRGNERRMERVPNHGQVLPSRERRDVCHAHREQGLRLHYRDPPDILPAVVRAVGTLVRRHRRGTSCAPPTRPRADEAELQFLSKCPRDASLYAPCVCNTDRAKLVSETMSRSVRSSCSNDEDVTAAQGFFNDYCAMNSGTTSFAGPPRPPGDSKY